MRTSLRTPMNTKKSDLLRSNLKYARHNWGGLSKNTLQTLTELTETYCFSVAAGHLQLLDGRWYITHAGLLQLAFRRRCAGIKTTLEERLSDSMAKKWVFKAVVYKSRGSKGFVGHGDADPSNVSPLVRGAEMRVAETRAVNRALRKAYGIGLCSVEEMGSFPSAFEPIRGKQDSSHPAGGNGFGNGQPRLR